VSRDLWVLTQIMRLPPGDGLRCEAFPLFMGRLAGYDVANDVTRAPLFRVRLRGTERAGDLVANHRP